MDRISEGGSAEADSEGEGDNSEVEEDLEDKLAEVRANRRTTARFSKSRAP